MSSQSDKIALCIRVPNALYYRLHEAAEARGQTHNSFVCGVLADALVDADRREPQAPPGPDRFREITPRR